MLTRLTYPVTRTNTNCRFLRNAAARKTFKRPVPSFQKRLDVVLLGPPNAGKSVLLNTLMRTKLSATSRKRHTTRMQILGVFNHRNVQLAFYDTPGFVAESSSQALRDDAKDLIKIARDSVSGKPDVVLLVVDSTSKLKDTYQDTFAEMAKMALDNTRMETILVLNKVDMVEPKQKLLTTTTELVSLINGVKYAPEDAHLAELDTTTFMISALKRDGTLDLKNYLISLAERKPWIIAEGDGITELTDRERVEQIVLEHLLDNAHEEIPYRSEVVCRGIKRKIAIKSLPYSPTPEMQQESSVQTIKSSKLNRIVLDKVIDDEADKTDRKVFKNFEKVTQYRIDVDIYVEKAAHRKILIGHKGRTLVKMRQAAVAQLEKIFGSQVVLFLWIKLAKGNNSARMISEDEDFEAGGDDDEDDDDEISETKRIQFFRT